MRARRMTGGILISLALAIGIAGAAHADDDEDDESDRGSSSVETWPPTDVSWPPLDPPDDQDGAPPVIPVP